MFAGTAVFRQDFAAVTSKSMLRLNLAPWMISVPCNSARLLPQKVRQGTTHKVNAVGHASQPLNPATRPDEVQRRIEDDAAGKVQRFHASRQSHLRVQTQRRTLFSGQLRAMFAHRVGLNYQQPQRWAHYQSQGRRRRQQQQQQQHQQPTPLLNAPIRGPLLMSHGTSTSSLRRDYGFQEDSWPRLSRFPYTVQDVKVLRRSIMVRVAIVLAILGPVVFLLPPRASAHHDSEVQRFVQSKRSLLDSVASRLPFGGFSTREDVSSLRRQYAVLVQAHKLWLAEKLGKGLSTSASGVAGLRQTITDWYISLPMYKMAVVPTIAACYVATAAWWSCRLPKPLGERALRFMATNFLDTFWFQRPWTAFTSLFSHSGPIHLVLNTFALWSVGAMGIMALSEKSAMSRRDEALAQHTDDGEPSSTSPTTGAFPVQVDFTWEALSALIFCGVAGNMATTLRTELQIRRLLPHLYRAESSRKPDEFHRIAGQIVGHMRVKGHGMSGGVYGMFAIAAVAVDEALRIKPIFFPSDWSVSLSTGFTALCCADALALFSGVTRIGHQAHLGGAAAGLFWAWKGHDWWESMRRQAIRSSLQSQGSSGIRQSL